MKVLKLIEIVNGETSRISEIAEHMKEYLHASAMLFSYKASEVAKQLHSIVGDAKLPVYEELPSFSGAHREQFNAICQCINDKEDKDDQHADLLKHVVLVLHPNDFKTFVPYMAARMNVPVLDPLPEDAMIVRIKRHDEALVLLTEHLLQFSASPEE